MLNDDFFNNWGQALGLSQATLAVIERVRSSPPSRRVQSGRGNVSGNYPSRKMGVTIQFESHRNELARIYEMEHDPDILEYYDQPPPFELNYLAKSGRRNRHLYTPDFFVIRKNSAGWEECKTEDDLKRLTEDSPNRYQQDENGHWRCPPAEAYAQPLGLYFRVWSGAEINWVFQQNFIWLEDYFRSDSLTVDDSVSAEILALVKGNEGITLFDLLQQAKNGDADAVYTLISTGQVYVDLKAERFANSDLVQVFSDQVTALAYKRAVEVVKSSSSNLQQIAISVGKSLIWDSECWEIINTGTNATTLLRSDNKIVDLPNEVLDKYIQDGKITGLTQEDTTKQDEIQEILRRARPEDIAEALQQYDQIQPYLGLNAAPTPSSTIRRWRIQYNQAEETYGSGYIGLLPNHGAKGNRTSKIDGFVRGFMVQFIQENYETLEHRRPWRVYQSLVEACGKHEPELLPPSAKTFYAEIKRRSGAEQTEKREGRRAAIQKRSSFVDYLELMTPRHGDRPFEIVHFDHTELDLELVSSLASLTQCNFRLDNETFYNLGRPWGSFLTDAYCRRLLAVYLSFEEPSYRTCMETLRICVQRFKRFPQIIVVDNGPEFHSNYFRQLLAKHDSTPKYRPPADARYGAVVERLFGTANTQFVHELKGTTQINRQHRQVTKSVRPSTQAVWTLGEFYESLCHWAYEIYDKRQHPTLGQSPREAFNSGLAIGGNRIHRRVEYDETFRMLTLPAPERETRKVQPGRGIKINHIYYWSNAFRDPEIEKSRVEVRYEPFDASVAYALVRGQWVKCISAHYQYLKGRSEKEMRLISKELIKRKKDQGKGVVLNDKELVQFLNTTEAKEGKFLKQRLQVCENEHVLKEIEGSEDTHLSSSASFSPSPIPLSLEIEHNVNAPATSNLSKSNTEDLEFYGEW